MSPKRKGKGMKTAIIYATKHGCTEKCALTLKSELSGETELFNIKTKPKFQFDKYDTILIGGSIHAGTIQRSIQKFCRNHLKPLLRKKIGLFLCCMEKGEKAEEQFQNAFPEQLRDHAKAKGCFGGAFNFDKMNFIEKAIIKKVGKIDHNISTVSEESMQQFIKEIQ
jgi:menaquinone-dependent protoporphyrinogen oxidase